MKFLSVLVMTMHPSCCKFGNFYSVILNSYIVDCTVNGNVVYKLAWHIIYAKMTISHSIVTPWVPWGVMNKWLIRSVPDPSSLSEGADTMQTTFLTCVHTYSMQT